VPHIHFDIIGGTQRVITQMYFPDEPGNQQDSLLSRIPAGPLRDRLIATQSSQPQVADALTFGWDVVLGTG
jgi:protocatechuate 3,4-dioxygenase beta subunit